MLGYLNVHPFFVHAPLVLIPTAAAMLWLSRAIRGEGFATATLLITVGAWLGAFAAMTSGFLAEDTFTASAELHRHIEQHETNGIVTMIITSVALLISIADARSWFGERARSKLWWARGFFLTWATLGCVFTGHSGATLVYKFGAAVTAPR